MINGVCEYCQRVGNHDCRCPNYVFPKVDKYCSYCKNGIYSGDKYIENDNGEYIHAECSEDTEWFVNWLGYDIRKEVENE